MMAMFLPITSSPPVKVMTCPFSEVSKSIVSPSFAIASAWRNDPRPLSLVLMTVIVSLRASNATAQRIAEEIVSMALLFTRMVDQIDFYRLALR